MYISTKRLTSNIGSIRCLLLVVLFCVAATYKQRQLRMQGDMSPQLMSENCIIFINGCLMQTSITSELQCHKIEEYFPGVWPCFQCREMPSQLTTMKTMLTELVESVNTLTQNVNQLHRDNLNLRTELKDKDTLNTCLQQETANWKRELVHCPVIPVLRTGAHCHGQRALLSLAAVSFEISMRISY